MEAPYTKKEHHIRRDESRRTESLRKNGQIARQNGQRHRCVRRADYSHTDQSITRAAMLKNSSIHPNLLLVRMTGLRVQEKSRGSGESTQE